MGLMAKPSALAPKKTATVPSKPAAAPEAPAADKPKAKIKFGAIGNHAKMRDKVETESTQALVKYLEFIVKEGINVGMVLPGMESTDDDPFVTKMTHGYTNSGCTRVTKGDRFETCPKCDYWFKNRSTQDEFKRGIKRPADAQSPSTKGLCQWVDFTWACEHESVKDGDKIVEKPISTVIDPDRIRERPCFLDEAVFDAGAEKCKNCPAFKSCYQGPQFVLFSSKLTKGILNELDQVATKKKAIIGGKEVPLKGNISLAWWLLNPVAAKGDEESIKKAKEIAKLVSFPMVITKTVDAKLDKMKGTAYTVKFAREPFIIPAKFQKRALDRARDLGEYRQPITKDHATKELKIWLDQSITKPGCFDNADVKDSDECIGKDGCAAYKTCCAGGKKNDAKKDADKKGSGTESKQQRSTTAILDDDDEDVGLLMQHLTGGKK